MPAIESEFIDAVLAPYRPECKYLKSAYWERGGRHSNGKTSGLLGLHGTCAIGKPFYIKDTGHFNAVEFNLCYNQLMYCLVAVCARHKLLDVFSGWDFSEFQLRQLPDMVIAEFSSTFHKPMRSESFEGRIDIVQASITRQGSIVLPTTCSFNDHNGGKAEGKVMMVILNRNRS